MKSSHVKKRLDCKIIYMKKKLEFMTKTKKKFQHIENSFFLFSVADQPVQRFKHTLFNLQKLPFLTNELVKFLFRNFTSL